MCYEEGNTDRGWIGMLIQAVGDLTSANANRGITCVCLRYSHNCSLALNRQITLVLSL